MKNILYVRVVLVVLANTLAVQAYVIFDNLTCVILLSSSVELSKVIDQRTHTGGKVKDSIYQLTKWNFT